MTNLWSMIKMNELRLSKAQSPETLREFSILRSIRAFTKVEKEVSDTHTDKSRLSAAIRSEDGVLITRQRKLTHKRQNILINAVRNTALSNDNDAVGLADTLWLRNCIIVRNGDVRRAISLASNYLNWRSYVKYDQNLRTPTAHVIELLTRGVFIVAGNHCRQDSPVLTIRYCTYNPEKFDVLDLSIAFGIMVEYVIRNYPNAETEGITLMEDMNGVTLTNLDMRLTRFLIRSLSRTFPVRIRSIFYVRSNRTMRAVLKFIAPFVARKLHTNVVVIEHDDGNNLLEAFDPHQIPTVLHPVGRMTWTPQHLHDMVDNVLNNCSKWPHASKYYN